MLSASVFEAVRLLVGDGLVAVGRLVGGGARRCEGERLADALADVEADQEVWEPRSNWLNQNAMEALGDARWCYAHKSLYGNCKRELTVCRLERDPFEIPGESASAAVVAPAADNTTDCGCGSGNKCPNTCRDDGVGLVDSMEAAYHYHRPGVKWSDNERAMVFICEGCSWAGPTEQAHARHRFQILADMKAATNRVAERLGGAS